MSQRIIITGTESTGKTELAINLSEHYKALYVPDCSRSYISKLNRKYNRADIISIAEEIIEAEKKVMQSTLQFFFSDNCLINIKIWLQYYNWEIPDWLNTEIVKRKTDLHLLCDIDIDWIPDQQRKNPHDRKELFERFKEELSVFGANYKIVSGVNDTRAAHAIQIINSYLSTSK